MRAIVLATAICLSAVGISSASDSQAAVRQPINIPPQDLRPALQTLAKEHDFQLVYRSEFVRDVRTAGAVGELTTEEALTRLLQGTGLTHRRLDDKTMTIVPLLSSKRGDDVVMGEVQEPHVSRVEQDESLWSRFRLAQLEQEQGARDTPQQRNGEEASDKKRTPLIGEVIVTATKREERLQDVPISVAVVGNQDIERRGLIGMEDYLRSIPGVNQMDKGGVDNAIVIRGISTSAEAQNTIVGSGATVATYFDETPITGSVGMGQGGGIDVRPVDIDRIEVLRGPQGTAWGNASLGGAMRIIPVKPELDDFSAKLAGSVSNTEGEGSENWMAQGVINAPVVKDKFAVRLVGYRYDESGFYRNVAGLDAPTIAMAENFGLGDYVRDHIEDDRGHMVSTGGRVAALWQATDKLNLSLNFLTQDIEQDGTPVAMVGGGFEQARVPIAPQGRVRGEAGEVADTDMDLVNLVMSYDFRWAELKAIASWVDSGQGFAQGWGLPFAFFGPISGTISSDFESFTVETRLASHLDGRFQFLGGLFYEDVKEGFVQTFGDWPGTPETNLFGTNPMFFSEGSRQLDQYAIFGEVSYDLTDKLEATVGGRYFRYEKDERQLFEGGLIEVPLGGGVPVDLDSRESDSTFKATLGYKPTTDSLVYVSWAEGFRLGRPQRPLTSFCDVNGDGIADGTNITIESTRRIDSDFLEQYEVGSKFAFFDRRMVIDAAAYYIEWEGLPILTFARCGGGDVPSSFIANVGAATSKGLDFQASVFVLEGLRLDFGAGYTDAELSEDAPGLGAEKGARLPASPELSANLAVQYDFNLFGQRAFMRVDSFYIGESFSNLPATPDKRAGDYIKVDARTGVEIGALSAEIFVRNLTDEDAFTWRGIVQGGGDFRLRPRTVGVQLGYRFE